MSYIPEPIEKLVRELNGLPGLGVKTAYRIAFYIADSADIKADNFSVALKQVKERIKICKTCFGYSLDDDCRICSDISRDKKSLCVVERPQDIFVMERGGFKGSYHVLHGVISPLDGVGPSDIKLKELFERLDSCEVTELVIALNPSVEGDATTMYIAKHIAGRDIRVSRLARGVPAGASIDYIDDTTLCRAIEERQDVSC
ncbi:MAG TPA: recombination mediator RecR [bacterium]|nr:recombination mediator RecR [bacterium]